MSNRSYLGDSVYVETRDGELILTTENGLSSDPSNTVVLEPEVYKALVNYVKRIEERR